MELGTGEIILMFLMVVVVFAAAKLPAIKNFKRGMRSVGRTATADAHRSSESGGTAVTVPPVEGTEPLRTTPFRDTMTVKEQLLKIGVKVDGATQAALTHLGETQFKKLKEYVQAKSSISQIAADELVSKVDFQKVNTPEIDACVSPQFLSHGQVLDLRKLAVLRSLSEAIENDQSALVAVLIRGGRSSSNRDKNGNSPLHQAVIGGHIDIAKILVDNGASPNEKNSENCTPLYYAAKTGPARLVAVLLDGVVAVAINETNEFFKTTALSAAAKEGHADIVTLLLDRGADANARDIFGDTPLSGGARKGHSDVVEILLRRGATVTDNMLFAAVLGNKTGIIKAMIDKGADPNKRRDGEHTESDTPLGLAAEQGLAGVVKVLLESGADPNKSGILGLTPLDLALSQGHTKTVQALLAAGADPKEAEPAGGKAGGPLDKEYAEQALQQSLVKSSAEETKTSGLAVSDTRPAAEPSPVVELEEAAPPGRYNLSAFDSPQSIIEQCKTCESAGDHAQIVALLNKLLDDFGDRVETTEVQAKLVTVLSKLERWPELRELCAGILRAHRQAGFPIKDHTKMYYLLLSQHRGDREETMDRFVRLTEDEAIALVQERGA